MTISFRLNRVLVALLVSFVAVLAYFVVAEVLHGAVWMALMAFGFVLLALSMSVSE